MNIVTIDGIPVYRALVDDEDTGMLRISLVDDPAVQSNFLAFAKAKTPLLYSVQDEAKRLVLGVVMRADFPIYRRDARLGEYYVTYDAETIRAMAEKYLVENRQNLVNLMHKAGTEVEGVQMVQYFIKGSGLSPEGFDDIADGSLFAEFHVTNDEVWDAIKAGTYKGFSLEGVFSLEPETDKDRVDQIVDILDGAFSRILTPNRYTQMKKKGLFARLAAALVEMGNVTTDKGILAWDGDEDLKAGDAVYIEDADGNRSAAPDGEYVTADNKIIVVADGKVVEIRDPQAEVAPAEPEAEPEVNTEENAEEGADAEPEALGRVSTDKGELEWDGEEDLEEGDAVFITDEEGNRNPAPDGDYTTEDGKVITVVEGLVASISDPAAEVAPAEQSAELTQAEKMHRIAVAYSESYNEKYNKIREAIAREGYEDFWVVDAGDDFAVIEIWSEEEGTKNLRFAISWDEAGNAIASDPVEVVPAFVTPEERDAADAEFKALQERYAALEAEFAKIGKEPAAQPAHETVSEEYSTGNKGLDRFARIAAAK